MNIFLWFGTLFDPYTDMITKVCKLVLLVVMNHVIGVIIRDHICTLPFISFSYLIGKQ